PHYEETTWRPVGSAGLRPMVKLTSLVEFDSPNWLKAVTTTKYVTLPRVAIWENGIDRAAGSVRLLVWGYMPVATPYLTLKPSTWPPCPTAHVHVSLALVTSTLTTGVNACTMSASPPNTDKMFMFVLLVPY